LTSASERRIESASSFANAVAMPMMVENARSLLQSAHDRGRLAHALILSGPAGSGKEELAAAMVTHLNGSGEEGADLWGDPVEPVVKPLEELEGDLVRIVRPKSRSRRILVDEIRELEKPIYLSAPPGKWKVGIIRQADAMNEAASNAFLKTLEEPPPDCLLLLLTSAPARLLPTIRSRCVEISLFNRTSLEERLAERMGAMEEALTHLANDGPGVWAALALKVALEETLASWKAERDKAFNEELKAEAAIYKQGSDGKWLQDREEAAKAELAGELIGMRASLVEWLGAWLGDAVRMKLGANRLELPGQQNATQAFAAKVDLPGLLARTEALAQLSALMETNAQETLVLETCLLDAFA
jgi:DNA polymerase-3 subunit delta'